MIEYVHKEQEFAIKNVALIKFNYSDMNNKYILNLLQSFIIKKQFRQQASGGVQKFVSLSAIRNLIIPVPPKNEQKEIANILSEIDNKIKYQFNRKEKLQELKKGLMQQLLTGKIRVKID